MAGVGNLAGAAVNNAMMIDDEAVSRLELLGKKTKKDLAMKEMMNQCADAAAASVVDAMVYDTKEDNLVDRFKKAVENLDYKVTKKMTAWEVKMQAQWEDMERRWSENLGHQGSGSSDDATISAAKHRIQRNIEATVTKMWDERMGAEDKIKHKTSKRR